MAYTAPRTWSDPELRTAAHFNANVRDNFLASEAAAAANEGDQIIASGANAFTVRARYVPGNAYALQKLMDTDYTNLFVDQDSFTRDPELRLSLPASTVWFLECYLVAVSKNASATSIVMQFYGPSGAIGREVGTRGDPAFTAMPSSNVGATYLPDVFASTGGFWGYFLPTISQPMPFKIGLYARIDQAGEVGLAFSPETATPVTIKKGSFLTAVRLS